MKNQLKKRILTEYEQGYIDGQKLYKGQLAIYKNDLYSMLLQKLEEMKIKYPPKKDIRFDYEWAWTYNEAIYSVIDLIKRLKE